ncbi:peptide deformylase [Arthrobacter gengyunqii]|uniref:Peptide deformylase n=1 Tax=Arthrobacter gengyunqii TaxID=2886940 RepID=A0A9X1S7U3_9MICC|nr:peptide deformylase [Arthrobacter gengyunqii]MCC3269384.1 peptide deformylase [Arthrobacter gengyunqii]UOY94670.1 peptide deformylase [Arthrobacter gengyunqii]
MPSETSLIRDLVLPLLETDLPPIVQLGHPALRAEALPYDGQLDSSELTALIDLMRRVMHAAPGVGLAAPQLGIPLQIAVLEDAFEDPEQTDVRDRRPLPFFAAINPVCTPASEDLVEFFEGCLSFNGYQGAVPRYRTVSLQYTDAQGAASRRVFEGWQARIVQHETDHLAGTVYVDKVLTRSLCSNAEYLRRWASPSIDEARRGLGF